MPELNLSQNLLLHLVIDMICVAVLVKGVYLRVRPSGDAPFTLVMLNLITFALATLLSKVSIDLGVSLGLFAVFGILRYRTRALEIGDLTYVFIMIGLAVINGISMGANSLSDLLLLDVLIVVVAGGLELWRHKHGKQTFNIRYDRIELLAPERRGELLKDLNARLGVECETVRIGRVDLLMATADLIIESVPTAD